MDIKALFFLKKTNYVEIFRLLLFVLIITSCTKNDNISSNYNNHHSQIIIDTIDFEYDYRAQYVGDYNFISYYILNSYGNVTYFDTVYYNGDIKINSFNNKSIIIN